VTWLRVGNKGAETGDLGDNSETRQEGNIKSMTAMMIKVMMKFNPDGKAG